MTYFLTFQCTGFRPVRSLFQCSRLGSPLFRKVVRLKNYITSPLEFKSTVLTMEHNSPAGAVRLRRHRHTYPQNRYKEVKFGQRGVGACEPSLIFCAKVLSQASIDWPDLGGGYYSPMWEAVYWSSFDDNQRTLTTSSHGTVYPDAI